MRFYIASRLENAAMVARLRDDLIKHGHWTINGSVRGDADALRQTALAETRGVEAADVLVALLPGGRGTHVELGIALGLGKAVIIYATGDMAVFGTGEETCAFYHHPNVTLAGSLAEIGLIFPMARNKAGPYGASMLPPMRLSREWAAEYLSYAGSDLDAAARRRRDFLQDAFCRWVNVIALLEERDRAEDQARTWRGNYDRVVQLGNEAQDLLIEAAKERDAAIERAIDIDARLSEACNEHENALDTANGREDSLQAEVAELRAALDGAITLKEKWQRNCASALIERDSALFLRDSANENRDEARRVLVELTKLGHKNAVDYGDACSWDADAALAEAESLAYIPPKSAVPATATSPVSDT